MAPLEGRFVNKKAPRRMRAQAFAYQSGGECFAVQPIAGENGATITRLKPMTAAQWRARMIGRR